MKLTRPEANKIKDQSMSALINWHDDSNQNEGEKQQSIDNRLAPSLMSWKVSLHLSLPSCSLFFATEINSKIFCWPPNRLPFANRKLFKPSTSWEAYSVHLISLWRYAIARFSCHYNSSLEKGQIERKRKAQGRLRNWEHRKHLFAQHFASLRNLSAVCARDVYQLKSVRSDFHIWIRLPTKGIRKKNHLIQRETGKSMDWRVIMLNIPPRHCWSEAEIAAESIATRGA